MLQKTIEKYTNILNGVKDSGMSIAAYCDREGINVRTLYHTMQNIRKNFEQETEAVQNLFYLYKECTGQTVVAEDIVEVEEIEDETPDKLTIVRNQSNKILSYKFDIPVRDSHHFIGSLSREEVESLYGLYTYYGGNLTARNVANEMPRFTLQEVRRLLRTFKCTKDSAWFPQHLLEEMSEEELNQYRMNLKERGAVKYADAQQERSWNALLKKVVAENNKLKQQLEDLDSYNFNITSTPIDFTVPGVEFKEIDNDIIIYLADMHIGARVQYHSLYSENEDYGEEEVNRRLDNIIKQLTELGPFRTIHVCLMGDMMDSVGVTHKTATLTHELPENMDGYEQLNVYLNVMHRFVNNLASAGICYNINMYSVRDGNHTGVFEHAATRALFAEISQSHPNITCTLFKDFFGIMRLPQGTWVVSHGKNSPFMKHGLPVNIDAKSKILLYEWFEDNNITGKNIHVVKADLHTENYNNCDKFDYRNVLSLFGASDYSSNNFSRNPVGCSFDMLVNNKVLRGVFTVN